jgi:tyrosinase
MSANKRYKVAKMSLHSVVQMLQHVSGRRETNQLPKWTIITILSLANVTIYGVHSVGVFLPWHRYAIWTFESVLRSECNYTGAQPYWDWTLDNPSTGNGSMLTSPVLEAFGGNGAEPAGAEPAGAEPAGCIQNGPFSGPEFLNIGPVESLVQNPRCLTRAYDVDQFTLASKWDFIYPATMTAKNYYQLQNFIDGLSFVGDADSIVTEAGMKPHALGHQTVGGDVRISLFAIPSTLSNHATS